jgi:hypothetical protein
MAQGRSFEEVDEMTIFDLLMITKYRQANPSHENLLAMIANWCGVWKPSSVVPDIDIKSVPDPRQAIREAFKGTKFPV